MLRKDDDEIGSGFQIWLFFVGPQWGKSIEPLLRSASLVETLLLFFRSSTYLTFYLCITDDHEMPRLLIGAAGSASRDAQTILDYLPRDGTRRKLPYCATPQHFIAKRLRSACHLLGWELAVRGKRKKTWGGHRCLLDRKSVV